MNKARFYLNLLIVWTLTGVWHGAGMNFVAWGLYYAVILIIEKSVLYKVLEKLPKVLRVIYSLFLVMVGWVLFASNTMMDALSYLGVMFGIGEVPLVDSVFLYNISSYAILLTVSVIAMFPYPKKIWNKYFGKNYTVAIIVVLLTLIVCTAYLVDSSYNPFLYFRF